MAFCDVMSSAFISKLPSQPLSHDAFGGKSHVVLGIKKPFLAAVTTTAKLTNPPINDGNSGPNTMPVNT